MNHSLPGSSLHGISQATVLEWLAISSSRGYSWRRDWTQISSIGRWSFTTEPLGKPSNNASYHFFEYPLCARRCINSLICIILNLHIVPISQASPFTVKIMDTERVSNLPKVKQLVSIRAEIWSFQNLMSIFLLIYEATFPSFLPPNSTGGVPSFFLRRQDYWPFTVPFMCEPLMLWKSHDSINVSGEPITHFQTPSLWPLPPDFPSSLYLGTGRWHGWENHQ